MLEKVRVAYGIWDIVFPHLFFTDIDSPQYVFFKILSLSEADQDFSLLFIDSGQERAVILVIDLHLGNFFNYFKFFECKIMAELPVENFDFMKVDVNIKGIIHQHFVVLLIVYFQYGSTQNRKRLLNLFKWFLELTLCQWYFS